MKNLANTPPAECDIAIGRELQRARVERVVSSRGRREVQTGIMGRLGSFTLWRAWYYWVAEGPFPLPLAEKLFEQDMAWRDDVRAGGHAAGPEPLTQAHHYALDGKRILDRQEETRVRAFQDSPSEGLRQIAQKMLDTCTFADKPAAAAHHSTVEVFHIDSELGLRLWADAARGVLIESTRRPTLRDPSVKHDRIRIRPASGGPWCVCDAWDGVGQMIEDGGTFDIEHVQLSDAEIEALGDFPGW